MVSNKRSKNKRRRTKNGMANNASNPQKEAKMPDSPPADKPSNASSLSNGLDTIHEKCEPTFTVSTEPSETTSESGSTPSPSPPVNPFAPAFQATNPFAPKFLAANPFAPKSFVPEREVAQVQPAPVRSEQSQPTKLQDNQAQPQNGPAEQLVNGNTSPTAGMEWHGLENAWKFYQMNSTTKGLSYSERIREVGVVDTVEAFFYALKRIPQPSETAHWQDYMFFRGGKGPHLQTPVIKPEWEDVRNARGGMWNFVFPQSAQCFMKARDVDEKWKELLMAMIGEQFGPYNDNVNGAYCCNRNGNGNGEYRLQVWLGVNDAETVKGVGAKLVEIMGLTESDGICFQYCSNTAGKNKPLFDRRDIYRGLPPKKIVAA
ncbi:eukaryotic translation initiation factor 4E-like [Paramacrobiotus metropolitanus]|uniref:eukaryotic translation initiation factor 4E-like n=1 Tax=Paramacrobiotus metropolitanus TaxID=2943436 RepID=UPI002445E95A|nr:eukaryotic translation initiation factor 4E-like [Paramacrobiotus metropolitanus]